VLRVPQSVTALIAGLLFCFAAKATFLDLIGLMRANSRALAAFLRRRLTLSPLPTSRVGRYTHEQGRKEKTGETFFEMGWRCCCHFYWSRWRACHC